MQKKSPYDIIKSRYVTEKSSVLESLKDSTSNPSLARCELPKYVFLVERKANKREIAMAIEQIYSEKGIKVRSVNTITIKPKKRRMRGQIGYKSSFKKAIVTLNKGNEIQETV
ncbi:MAG: 50S ribosomal protein L23 [Chlamydiae bacterium]|nr:50S ribosomal protein L23 [Chlamydiota bacterium]